MVNLVLKKTIKLTNPCCNSWIFCDVPGIISEDKNQCTYTVEDPTHSAITPTSKHPEIWDIMEKVEPGRTENTGNVTNTSRNKCFTMCLLLHRAPQSQCQSVLSVIIQSLIGLEQLRQGFFYQSCEWSNAEDPAETCWPSGSRTCKCVWIAAGSPILHTSQFNSFTTSSAGLAAEQQCPSIPCLYVLYRTGRRNDGATFLP